VGVELVGLGGRPGAGEVVEVVEAWRLGRPRLVVNEAGCVLEEPKRCLVQADAAAFGLGAQRLLESGIDAVKG
jgi:hypothetical protein